MACNCKNGTTEIDALTAYPGATPADANYLINLTHWTCGNRKICVNGFFPITANLNYQVMGTPNDLGDGNYCCDVLCTGTVTYMPYKCGCNQQCPCNQCPETDNIFVTMCVPCSSATVPTITAGKAVATPSDVKDCCNVTNAVGIAASFNVSTTTTANTDGE